MKTIVLSLSVLVILGMTSCDNSKKTNSESAKKSSADIKTASMTDDKKETCTINALCDKEKAEGWILLFDGKSSEGWTGYKKPHFPASWEIVDGTIHGRGSGRGELGAKDGGDIIYKDRFENFDLKLEWKISKGGNSGIFYLGDDWGDYIWKASPECQVLDNVNHPDAKLGINNDRQAGSLYDLIPAVPQNAKPYGEWNSIEIICKDRHVSHIQNGVKVLEYDIDSKEFQDLVKGSKFAHTENGMKPNWGNFVKSGLIGLQDHGDDVWFRNIKIRKL